MNGGQFKEACIAHIQIGRGLRLPAQMRLNGNHPDRIWRATAGDDTLVPLFKLREQEYRGNARGHIAAGMSPLIAFLCRWPDWATGIQVVRASVLAVTS